MPTGHVNSREFSGQELSPLRSRSSHDSDDSLRALELLEGAAPRALNRERSFSISGFGFERDLLPLSASLSEPDEIRGVIGEKSIGLINGKPEHASLLNPMIVMPCSLGVALVVGSQASSILFVLSWAVDSFVQIGSGILYVKPALLRV
jgi:hypothetical protein